MSNHTKAASGLIRLFVLVTVLCGMMAMPFSAAGQSATVKGTVTDNTGEPLMGAGIMVKGTSNGTITDLDGNFELKGVTYPVTLVASFIGLSEKEVTLENAASSPCAIVLEEDQNYLNEVVVVGYGTQKKVNVTGAVGVVDGKELAMRPVNSAAQALQGADPSLLLTSGSGGIEGSEYSVTIRGSVSINSGSPLILIDGVEGSLSQVNPNDIESVSVLKDASSTAIYGSRGANGVILVTTKQGATAKPSVTANVKFGISQLARDLDLMNKDEFLRFRNDYYYIEDYIAGKTPTAPQYDPSDYTTDTDWLDEITRLAYYQSYSVSVSGKAKGSNYYGAMSYVDEQGIVKGSGVSRINARLNLSKNFLTVQKQLTQK